MTRTVRERALDNRSARSKLKPSGKPYWRAVDIGLHIGYRKGQHGGRWVIRRYLGGEQYAVKTIGAADDNQEADGREILTFHQAQSKVREIAKQYRDKTSGSASLTIRDAVGAYLQGRHGRDQHLRLNRYVLAADIAERRLGSLSEMALAAWKNNLPDTVAASTIRRITTDLRAALNVAARAHRKALPPDFPSVVQHGLAIQERAVAVAREAQVLTDPDIRRLIDAAHVIDARDGWKGDLARMIIVLAATGARFSQVIRLTVADVQSNRIMIPVSAKGRGTKKTTRVAVRVGDDVIAALKPAVTGRKGRETLLLRPHWIKGPGRRQISGDRAPWQWSSELWTPWTKMREMAGIDATVIPYAFRHSSIVRGLRAGLPVRLVAALHDTSTVMIERHYSAFIVDAMDELAAKAIVPLTSAPVSQIKLQKT